MKNIFLILMVLVQGAMLFSQVGIGTQNPHNSAMLEVAATDKGFLLPRMTSVQRNAISSPESGLQVYDVNTSSIWYFNGVFWVNTQAMASVGDIKSGIQLNDHSGWVLLDGRLINSLSANQQAVATSVGLSGNLPNATNATSSSSEPNNSELSSYAPNSLCPSIRLHTITGISSGRVFKYFFKSLTVSNLTFLRSIGLFLFVINFVFVLFHRCVHQ
jgi:hypothetical protein